MPKAYQTWTVLPHNPIEELTENLWRVSARLPEGPPLERVMAVARRSDGKLVVHSAIALDDASMKKLDAWGEVGFLIVPNGFHRLDAKVWKDRYPRAMVLAPSGSKQKVEEVVPVDATYEGFPADPAVRLEMLDGVGKAEGVMIVTSSDGTSLVFNDAIFNMPHQPGFQGFILKALGSSGGPRVSRIGKLFLVKDKAAYRANLERLAQLPNLKRALVAHQDTITGDVAGVLREVARGL